MNDDESLKRHDFPKQLLNTKYVLRFFSTRFIWNISPSKKTSARYYHEPT